MLRWGLLAGGTVHNAQHLSRELIDEVYRQAHTPSRGKAFTSTQKNDMTWHGLRSDMTGRLHEITVPTLLIHGAQDRAVPLSYAQKAHALIKNSELVILQDCGHWAQREKPEEFHQVRSFLLQGARTGKIATVGPDRLPHVVPVWFHLDGDEIICPV
jgi:pimeloyl-ACP methyl ester carboxylesterase